VALEHMRDKKVSITLLGHELTLQDQVKNVATAVAWAEDYIKGICGVLDYLERRVQLFQNPPRFRFPRRSVGTRRGERPRTPLKEDDPTAMGIIHSVLHYQNVETYVTLHAKELAAVALHSDKYDCTRALRPWISQWFGRIRGVSSTDDLAFLLVAAYFFPGVGTFQECIGSDRQASERKSQFDLGES